MTASSKPVNGLSYFNCRNLACPTWSSAGQFIHAMNNALVTLALLAVAALALGVLALWLLGPRSPIGRVHRIWAAFEGTCVRRYGP